MKEWVIEEFNETKTLVSINKEANKIYPKLCTTHFIRMLIAKMKILNAYLQTDVDCMQKEHEIFKSHASIVMEEYENNEETFCVLTVDDKEHSITETLENQGGYLRICDVIKQEYDLIEDYMETAKQMKLDGLHF
jgi:hypothetical protein